MSSWFSRKNNNLETKCLEQLAKSKNEIDQNKYKNICKVINQIQITEDITVINENFTKFLHLWFNDNAVLTEIYKHLASKGICILHEIVIWYNISGSGQTMFVIPHNYGYDDMVGSNKKHHTSYLDYGMYYNTQISECQSDIMAIPITIYYNEDPMAHSNMLVIRRQLNQPVKIICEVFEPYGLMSKRDNSFEILHLIQNLFSYDINSQDEIQVIFVAKTCLLQFYVLSSEYKDSCSVFSMWYAIRRLLNPEENPITTVRSMQEYLIKTDPVQAIKNIILSFISIINIDNRGIINSKKMIDKRKLNEIIGGTIKIYKKHKSIKTRKNKQSNKIVKSI